MSSLIEISKKAEPVWRRVLSITERVIGSQLSMRILAVAQKNWGKRIIEFITENAPESWQIETHIMPTFLPPVIDEPEDLLPYSLPNVDLVLVLAESQGLAQLVPELAKMTEAKAVIAPVDNELWLPMGLQNQVQRKLKVMNVDIVFPTPFCSLTTKHSHNKYILDFARHFGKPALEIDCKNGKIQKVSVMRSSPCGNTNFVAENLIGIELDKAEERSALLHQYYPCLASVALIHKSAFMTKATVKKKILDYRL